MGIVWTGSFSVLSYLVHGNRYVDEDRIRMGLKPIERPGQLVGCDLQVVASKSGDGPIGKISRLQY